MESTIFYPVFRDYYFLGTSFKPNSGGSWQHIPEFKINSLGFRGEEFPILKEEGTLRIACFGGSATHAGNYPEKLAKLLKKEFRDIKKIEVINAAVPCWTTTQNLIQFITRVIYLKPDFIIIYEAINGINVQEYKWFYHLPAVDYKKYSGFLRNHSVLYNFIIGRVNKLKDTWDYFDWKRSVAHSLPLKKTGITVDEFSPQIFKTDIENFIFLAKHHDITVVLVTMPLNYEENFSYKEKLIRAGIMYAPLETILNRAEQCNGVLRSLAKFHGIELIDAAKTDMNRHPEYFCDLCHFSEKGAQELAKFLAQQLKPIIKKRATDKNIKK